MAFVRQQAYSAAPLLRRHIIDNSDTVQVGDAVRLRNGDLEIHTAGVAIHGVVVDIQDRQGNSIFGSLALTGTATVTQPDIVAVASDNETVDQIAALVDTAKTSIYSAAVTGTMNTTTASNKPGGWINADDENSIDETTHSRTITDVRTWKNHGVDPNDTSRMLVSINHSEVWDNGAAMA